MPRYRLLIEYDGTPYKGFQRQNNGHTVQGALERAIKRFTGEEVTLQAAGRTDTGVHATGQVAHVDLARDWTPFRVFEATNALLVDAGESAFLLSVDSVPDDFHARFSATRRHYLYRIINRRTPLALERNRAWLVRKGTLDADTMHDAAQVLVGHHDFTTFRATQCQSRSPLKTLDGLNVARRGNLIEITTRSRSYLHSQVRSMAGCLKAVGEGRWTADDLRAALEARDRKACAALAPPEGLYLTRVDYD